jgi:uncharacterized protein YjbI with pentapeptide repeats
MIETTREHLEFHLRRLKGARAAAAELSLKPSSGGLELLAATHLAVLALEATLAEAIEPEHSALTEVAADLARAAAAAGDAAQVKTGAPAGPLAAWWRLALAPFDALAQANLSQANLAKANLSPAKPPPAEPCAPAASEPKR